MAKEALTLHLYGMERDGDAIPVLSTAREIQLESNQVVVLIEG